MNDRYLFRAKRIDNGEWVEGFYTYYPCGFNSEDKMEHVIRDTVTSEDCNKLYFVDPSTICQCTGLKKFFEKDIVKRTDIHEVGEPSVGIIEYDVENTEFIIHWIYKEIYSPTYPWKDKIKVIGNIFDNPELMEQED